MTHNPLRSCADRWGQNTLREIISVGAQLDVIQAPSFSFRNSSWRRLPFLPFFTRWDIFRGSKSPQPWIFFLGSSFIILWTVSTLTTLHLQSQNATVKMQGNDILCQKGAGRGLHTFSPVHGPLRRTLPQCERIWPAGSSGRSRVSWQPLVNCKKKQHFNQIQCLRCLTQQKKKRCLCTC